MKRITCIFISSLITLGAFSQLQSPVKKEKTPVRTNSTVTATAILPSEKNIPVPQLPDLKIVSLDVKLYNSSATDSTRRYLIINYTLKNEGTVDVKLFDVKLQGFITSALEHTNGAGGGYMPASLKLSDILKPGATYNGSFQTGAKDIVLPYAKFYRLFADYGNSIKEINENNNAAAAVIMIQ